MIQRRTLLKKDANVVLILGTITGIYLIFGNT